MDVIECIKTRRSVRRYTEEPVSHEKLEEIIEAARWSPSWKNSQTVRYIAVEDKDIIKKIAEECVLNFEYNTKTLLQAQTVIILATITKRCGYEKDGSFSTSKGTGWEMFDAGIAAQTFCLAAHNAGVGSCIMGVFDEDKIKEVIGLPEGQSVSAVIPIGIPKFNPDATPRKEVADILSYR